MMTDHFDFDHVNLIPRKCIVTSRSECSTKVSLREDGVQFQLPIVPANMECVIDPKIAKKLASHGYFYIYHRFGNDVLEFSQMMKAAGLFVSISIGVGTDAENTLRMLDNAGIIPEYITIDIAHGHAESMINMIQWIRTFYAGRTQPYVIAGNVSTAFAVIELEKCGANAIKVGIGPGSACTTYMATGFGSRGIQASVIRECAYARKLKSTKIIADGGIKDPGDIAKALVLGADFVMVGGMFSGLIDSPGSIVEDGTGRKFKEFWGSASAHQSGKTNRIEGTKKLMPLKSRHYLEEMNYLKECLQSAISYGGGRSIDALKNVEFVVRNKL